MKTFSLYQCEFCGKQYNNEETCKACEDNHKKPVAVEAKRYVCKINDQTGFPLTVEVYMDDGSSATYRRLGGGD